MEIAGCEIRRLSELPVAVRRVAAGLYWLAFRDKLGRLLGPDARALALLARVLRADHALVALAPDGRVIGVGGFRSPQGGFVVLDADSLAGVYGDFGGWWRGALIGRLSREVDNTRFLIDGLAVAPDWRGRGIGAALLAALEAEAWRRGYRMMRLDVADANVRARALYLRLGFDPMRHDRLLLLAPVFGMRGSTMMVKPVSVPDHQQIV